MGAKYVNIDRKTGLLLPPDLREWVKDNALVHLVVEAVELCEVRRAKVNERGTGSRQYPPSMMLALLIYNYAMGVFSSRRIERQTYESVAVRYICANTHPDHDTVAKFRRENGGLIHECFVQVLQMAQELGLLKMGTIILDGTKIKANASRDRTYGEAELAGEVERCLAEAKQADEQEAAEGEELPEDLAAAPARLARLREAQARLAARRVEKAQPDQASDDREDPPQGPGHRSTPRTNLTDPSSSLMRTAHGDFVQGFNVQAVTNAEPSALIVHTSISGHATDRRELWPTIRSIDPRLPVPQTVLVDAGYDNQAQISALQTRGVTVYCPPQKKPVPHPGGYRLTKHRRRLAQLREARRAQLQTPAGQALYARRRHIEPIFHVLKNLMGFRQFLLRGLSKVALEWELLALAFNCRKLARLRPA